MSKLLNDAGQVFRLCAKRLKILDHLSWDPAEMHRFLRSSGTRLPKPKYSIDRHSIERAQSQLGTLPKLLQGDHPVLAWLRRTHSSYVLAAELVLNTETPIFYLLSSELYQSAGPILQTARAILRHSAPHLDSEYADVYTASEVAAKLQARVDAHSPKLTVQIAVTERIASRVVAGINRIRLRADSLFSQTELAAIWHHEIETHCFTAHNGLRQEPCSFLASGGPCTTQTQEGLASFCELFAGALTQPRLHAISNRILAVDMAERGADFIDVFRWYQSRCSSDTEAFYSTQRVFRGAVLSGRYPFTKDVVYLAGLCSVYEFLKAAVATSRRSAVESLICGRVALEDVTAMELLRASSLLGPPFYTPLWLSDWSGLVSFFNTPCILDRWKNQCEPPASPQNATSSTKIVLG